MFQTRDTRLLRTKTVRTLLLWPMLFCLLGGCYSKRAAIPNDVITEETPLSYLSEARPGADTAPSPPQLRIETGMHTAPIHAIASASSERYLATASDDKTVRIWDLHTGSLLSTLRPPIGPRGEGEIYAVAVSPDGETIACGGLTPDNRPALDGTDFISPTPTYCIYLFDRSSGQIVRQIAGLPNSIWLLAYAPDGRSLAAALGGSSGIRVYRTSNLTQIAEDHAYADYPRAMKFDRTGRLLTASGDAYLRLYDKDIHLIRQVKAPSGGLTAACFSPDGSKVAIGYSGKARMDLLSAQDLSLLSSVDTRGLGRQSVCALAWSQNGENLYAAGTFVDRQGVQRIRRWRQGGRGAYSDLACGVRGSIWNLLPLRDGRVVFSSLDPAWGTLDTSGALCLRNASINDYRDGTLQLLLSGDGDGIQLSSTQIGPSPLRFWLKRRLLEAQPTVAAVQEGILHTPLLQTPDLPWEEGDPPRLNGRKLPIEKEDAFYCEAIAPNKQALLVGSKWKLLCCDKAGKALWQTDSHEGVDEANISEDGRIAVVACGDGTVRWYSMADGQELCALFLHPDRRRWALWTPSGYYDCSQDGESLIAWQVNNGPGSAASLFPAAHFKAGYYRPDVLSRILETRDETEALHLADAARTPPEILSP